ncbi:Protein of unknown function [Rhizobium sp. NFR07]|uniref:DUF2628 domain-containing protein n=1 Tax=Rhizobium sp. NFR07 TaxID=1566262 RepID=UPI0008F40DC6|nr:DUF2628 domain-containing protein [Rhizobium sp. NFR07]SFB54709.1 Protein of unknown function [Rhizobium sp. NFR07]
MRSYLVLTPPGGPDKEHRSTLILPDGFSWAALLFPWIWLIWHRLWIVGILVFLVQGAAIALLAVPGFALAGALLGLATSLLVALEGRNHYGNSLIRRGWVLERVISAPDLRAAEDIYFSSLPKPAQQPLPSPSDWAKHAKTPPASGWQGPALGLFDHGGR